MNMSEDFRALKADRKAKFDLDRKRFMEQAISKDDGLWTKHTEFHWSRMVGGQRLDYWPSRKKWMYRNKVSRGDVYQFIKKKEKGQK